MADSPTAVEIFKPLDQDYALTGLRKLFGCMVDQLWKSAGTCSDTSNVLVQGLAWFNGGVLILAGIVACYLLLFAGGRHGERRRGLRPLDRHALHPPSDGHRGRRCSCRSRTASPSCNFS